MKCKSRKMRKYHHDITQVNEPKKPRRNMTKKIQIKEIEPKKEIENQFIVIPTLTRLEEAVNATVIGQENVVRSVCTKIYESLYFPQLKTNILLVGKSGTGKTEIVRQLAENLNIPCTIEDSTKYTEEGYVGASVTDMIENLIKEANNNFLLASRGIIFIDEIDKKASRGDYRSDVNKEGVLKSLLKIVEGTTVNILNPNYTFDMPEDEMNIKFDTSNIIFIFGGAFEGLDKIRDKRLNRNKIGFTSAEANHIVINNYMNTSFTKEDLVEYGLPIELIGRISSIYETKDLQVDDLEKILTYSKKSEFRKYETIFRNTGKELVYSEKLFRLIAERAKKTSTGARELNSLVSHIFEKIMYDMLSNANATKYTKCILEDEIVRDNTKYHWE